MKTPVLGIEIIKIQHVNLARPQKYFLPVAIAGLQFTVDGGGGESKKYQNTIPIFKTVFKRRQKMMQGNRI